MEINLTLDLQEVGGTDTQVQFNDAGSFGGDAGLTYNKTTDTLNVNGVSVGRGQSSPRTLSASRSTQS